MAYWGQALVLGPNINVPMTPDDEPKAHELAQKAVALKAKASARERAYIDAVAQRYSGKADDRAARDQAYADAMRELSTPLPGRPRRRHALRRGADGPAALELLDAGRDALPRTRSRSSATLESVLARKPDHPGANHYYIHAVEATKNPERAEAAADRLLHPDAGRRPHGAHARPHLHAGRPLRRRLGRQRAGDRGGRGLHHPVPRPGHLSDGLLPAQHPLPVVRPRPWRAAASVAIDAPRARWRRR